MNRSFLRLTRIAALAAGLVAALPAVVAAECNGPGCGPMDTGGVEGPQALVFLVILVAFATAMAVAEARRR